MHRHGGYARGGSVIKGLLELAALSLARSSARSVSVAPSGLADIFVVSEIIPKGRHLRPYLLTSINRYIPCGTGGHAACL